MRSPSPSHFLESSRVQTLSTIVQILPARILQAKIQRRAEFALSAQKFELCLPVDSGPFSREEESSNSQLKSSNLHVSSFQTIFQKAQEFELSAQELNSQLKGTLPVSSFQAIF
ncbi:hypothetical protein MRB53_010407 [Persea americana]|uniref:Uncharacterized protein n=1 Tax=Persea americana TaxID=3435 RepID=A0ACC2LS29_PERAE|nr:hypothetical protein MRB53_010407 [Persea americana]